MIRHVTLPHDTPREEVELLKKAASNQEDARAAVRALLARRPALVASLSNTAAELEDQLIDQGGGKEVLVHESMRAELEQLRASLRQPQDGALDELLIAQISLCWLTLNFAERLRNERWGSSISSESANFWDLHISRLRSDFFRAARTLAAVRRILVPVVQINLAERQVNQFVT